MTDFSNVPSPPEKPDPDSCCGSGCVPCIFDYYDIALMAWAEKHAGVKTWREADELATKYTQAKNLNK